MIPTSWPDFMGRWRLVGGRYKNKKTQGAGKHVSTEEPNGHDHRPRCFVRGSECWKAELSGIVPESGVEKRIKSGVWGQRTVVHFGSRLSLERRAAERREQG